MFQKLFIPIIQNRFYFIADVNPPKDIHNAFFFNIDEDLVYEPYYQDFGPVNIAKIWKYINEIHKIFTNLQYNKNIFYHHCSPSYKKCTNAVLLICAYQIFMMKKTAEQAYKPFQKIQFKAFRDASYGKCSYKCTILQCLKGLQYAVKLGWFSFKKFDIVQYEHYEQLENGNLNWIVPDKIIAFSSPYDMQKDKMGNRLLGPKNYIPIFKKLGVKAVIRLNSPTYQKDTFEQSGIAHHDLYFTDGTSPTLQIVQKFLEILQSTDGAVAVHCKAGLGRTGTLIACYAMKHYRFYASSFIGWIRLCRPGSVLGPQQYFLLQNEQKMLQKSQKSPVWKQIKEKLDSRQLENLQLQMQKISIKDTHMNEQEKQICKKGQTGQGNRLIQAKKKNHRKKQKVPSF